MRFPFSELMFSAAIALVAGAATAKAGEINFWVTEPLKAKAEQVIAAFEKENPDIKVRMQFSPYGGLESKVMIALRSGSPPDLIEVQTSWIPSYQATNTLDDIGALIASSNPLSDFVPSALNAATIGGKIYGLPFQAEAIAMIYRRDMYRDAGLDPDKPAQTWEEMIEISKKLTTTTSTGQRRYGYGIAGGGPEGQGNTLYRSLPYIWMNGGDILSADMKSSTLDQPEAIAAVKFYTEMYTKLKVAPPSTLENDGLALRRLFISGAVAHYQGTPTELERFAIDAPTLDYGVAIMPHPKGRQTTALLGGWAFVMPKAAKNREDTQKLLKYLAKPERIAFLTRTFPASLAGMETPRFSDPRLAAFKEMLKQARPQPNVPGWLEISTVYYKGIQEILIGGASVEEAMKIAAKDINAILKK